MEDVHEKLEEIIAQKISEAKFEDGPPGGAYTQCKTIFFHSTKKFNLKSWEMNNYSYSKNLSNVWYLLKNSKHLRCKNCRSVRNLSRTFEQNLETITFDNFTGSTEALTKKFIGLNGIYESCRSWFNLVKVFITSDGKVYGIMVVRSGNYMLNLFIGFMEWNKKDKFNIETCCAEDFVYLTTMRMEILEHTSSREEYLNLVLSPNKRLFIVGDRRAIYIDIPQHYKKVP